MITWVRGLDREEEKPNMEVFFSLLTIITTKYLLPKVLGRGGMLQCSARPGCTKYKVNMAQWQARKENRTEAEEWPGLDPFGGNCFLHQLK